MVGLVRYGLVDVKPRRHAEGSPRRVTRSDDRQKTYLPEGRRASPSAARPRARSASVVGSGTAPRVRPCTRNPSVISTCWNTGPELSHMAKGVTPPPPFTLLIPHCMENVCT